MSEETLRVTTKAGQLLLMAGLTFHSGRRLADHPEFVLDIEDEARAALASTPAAGLTVTGEGPLSPEAEEYVALRQAGHRPVSRRDLQQQLSDCEDALALTEKALAERDARLAAAPAAEGLDSRYAGRLKVEGGIGATLIPGTVYRVERITEHQEPTGTDQEAVVYTIIDFTTAAEGLDVERSTANLVIAFRRWCKRNGVEPPTVDQYRSILDEAAALAAQPSGREEGE